MYCPESVMRSSAYLWICHYGKGDIDWNLRPLSERINPLRYEIGIRTEKWCKPRFYINRKGCLSSHLSNLTWRLWRKRLYNHPSAFWD